MYPYNSQKLVKNSQIVESILHLSSLLPRVKWFLQEDL